MIGKLFPKIITPVLVFSDLAVVIISFLLGFYIYHQFEIELFGLRTISQPLHIYLKLSILFGITLVIIFERMGLYKNQMSILNIEETRKIFKGIFLCTFLFIMAIFFLKIVFYFSRLITIYSVFIICVLLNGERLLFFKLHQYLHLKGIGVKNTLIYGAGEVGSMLAKRLVSSPRLGYLPVGFIDDDISRKNKQINVATVANPRYLFIFGGLDSLERVVKENKVENIFIAMPSVKSVKINRIIRECQELKIKYIVIPNLFGLNIQRVAYTMIDSIPLLTLKEHKVNYANIVLKKFFDILFSALALIIFSPLILIISILIKIDSKGSIIFQQNRVGKDGKLFIMYKFRTLYVDTPKYANCPRNINDPRITRIGKILRRTSLDEAPQFLSVLKGDMSIVGPRPEMPFIVKSYNGLQRERLKVKPGITGLWQISGDRGGEIHDDINYDLYYIENMSVLLDFIIILRSVGVVIRGVGA